MDWIFGWRSRRKAQAEQSRAEQIESGIAVGPVRVAAVHCSLPDWPDWAVYLKVCGRWERAAKLSTLSMAIEAAKGIVADLKVAEKVTEAESR